METLECKLLNRLTEMGASIIGFADLRDVENARELGYRYGISIAVALKPDIINNLHKGVTAEYEKEYLEVNNHLDKLALITSQILKEEGFMSHPQIVTDVTTNSNMESLIPHKTIATRAGVGWIGKCALLVTGKYGSAIRLTSILTNAELVVGTPINRSHCGECKRCVEKCPGNAVKGANWSVAKGRDEYYDHLKCRKEARRRSGLNGINRSLCGVCILTCPFTKKYISSNGISYKGNEIK